MTSLKDRAGSARSQLSQWARTALRSERRRLLLAVGAVLAATVMLTPWSWAYAVVRLVTGLGWRWVPVLLLAAGLTALLWIAARRWGHRGGTRRRPVAVRAPLFAHVTVLLLLAVTVAGLTGVSLWLTFGRPSLSAPGTTPPTQPGPTAPATAWTVQNTFDAMKIVLAVVAGIGGVVALTVAYRKQGHSEAAEHREDTKLFNDRFGKAADELGSDKAAVRLAGVYAMAGLADDWTEGRQTCIDVLCAYLRMPYTPPPQPPPDPAPAASSVPAGLPLRTPEHASDDQEARQEQQVRHTVLAVIREHLQPAGTDRQSRWHGHRFNLTGAIFDGGSLSHIDVTTDTDLDFRDATFSGGTVDFRDATFSGGTVDFRDATFSGGTVDFVAATFSGGTVNFVAATFSGGTVDFRGATFSGGGVFFSFAAFSGGEVDFRGATFSGCAVFFSYAAFFGGEVDFRDATFSGGKVAFLGAMFPGGEVAFRGAAFTGGTVDFRDATFSGDKVAFLSATFPDGEVFRGAAFSGGEVAFRGAAFSGGTVDFSGAAFSGGEVAFPGAAFSGSTVDFSGAAFSGGEVAFPGAAFSGGTVDFSGAAFSGGRVDLAEPRSWQPPPVGVDGSEPGVRWPSPERIR